MTDNARTSTMFAHCMFLAMCDAVQLISADRQRFSLCAPTGAQIEVQ
jgi:hypothetical protein